MPTQDEKNLALNQFMSNGCYWMYLDNDPMRSWCHVHKHYQDLFNFYADTPEARERTWLLKNEFVRRQDTALVVETFYLDGQVWFNIYIGAGIVASDAPDESHAILDAIYEAIR